MMPSCDSLCDDTLASPYIFLVNFRELPGNMVLSLASKEIGLEECTLASTSLARL